MSGPYLIVRTIVFFSVWPDFSKTHLSIVVVRDLIDIRSAWFFLTYFAVYFHNFDKYSAEFDTFPSLNKEYIRLVL